MQKFFEIVTLLLSLFTLFGCDKPKGRPDIVDLSEPVYTQQDDFDIRRQQHGVTMPEPGSVQHVMDATLKQRTVKGLTDFQYSIVDQTMGSAPLNANLSEEDAEAALTIETEAFSLRITNGGKFIVNDYHLFHTADEVSAFLLTSGLNDRVTEEQLALLSWNIDQAVEGTKWGFIKRSLASIFKPIIDKWAEGK